MKLVRYTYPTYRSLAPSFDGFRSPWSGLETEINRLFESAVSGFDAGGNSGRFPVDLYEDKENTYVRAELPGVNRDDISVEMVDGYLTIAATRKTSPHSTRSGQAHSTRSGQAAEGQSEDSFSFSRSVAITDEVQADKVAATYENGVLTVTLPKREEVKPKKITVAVR